MLHSAIRQGKEIRGVRTGGRKVKLLLFADAITGYTENKKESTNKLFDFDK